MTQRQAGWVNRPRLVEEVVVGLPRPLFGYAREAIKDTGKGKVVLLSDAAKKVLKRHIKTRDQGAIGSCVGNGYAHGVDYLKCAEIAWSQQSEVYRADTCAEATYGLSRFEVGGGRLGNDDGSLGAWGAKSLVVYGTLDYFKYPSVDLSGGYSVARCKAWGKDGLPDILEPEARQHLVRTVSLVTNYEEARDAIANGYPVVVCSYVGFGDMNSRSIKRDAEGFLRASGEWAHCMVFIGVDDKHGRPGLLCLNSWGLTWITGPMRHDCPPGSFWVDADTVNTMLGREKDSFAISNHAGYQRRKFVFHNAA